MNSRTIVFFRAKTGTVAIFRRRGSSSDPCASAAKYGDCPKFSWLLAGLTLALAAPHLIGQQSAAQPATDNAKEAAAQATAQDHQNMMDQLGIKALRPGPSGNESAPNHANYDEATANPYPNLPDVLTLKNGKKVTYRGHVVESAPARDRGRFRPRSAGPRSQERAAR